MEPFAKIQYQITPPDSRRRTVFITDRLLKQVKIPSLWVRLLYTLPLAALLVLLALDNARERIPLLAVLAALIVFLLTWQMLFRMFVLRKLNRVMQQRELAEEEAFPTEAAFYPDRLTITHARTHSVFPWQEITDVYESADGLYLVHQRTRYLYLPARFFDPASALAVTSFLQQTFGVKYARVALMQAAISPESVGEVGQPEKEAEPPRWQFDFAMTGAEVSAVAGWKRNRLLAAATVLVTAGCLLHAHSGNIRAAAMAVAVWLMILLVFVLAFVKARRQEMALPSKAISLRWYDDHVTVITHQADEAVNQIGYRKMKAIRRQGKMTVIIFKDGTFLYVPLSAAESKEKFTDWERFLKEKYYKYSKK